MAAAPRSARQYWADVGRLGLVLALGFALSGCVESEIEGAANYVGSLGGGPSLGAPRAHPVQIFIASTRKGESGAAAQAASTDGAHYALDILTIPPGHRTGAIEEPMWGAANAKEHIVVAEERKMDGDEFRTCRLLEI